MRSSSQASGPLSWCLHPTGSLPLTSQESAVVEDLLYVLVGVDGRYITAQPLAGRQSRTFLVDPSLDLSIKELVNRVLPVAASYSTVTRWALLTGITDALGPWSPL